MSDDSRPAWDMTGLFPAADHAHWRQQAQAALKGAPFERLISHSYDGITIQPLYEQIAQEAPRALRQQQGPWCILSRLDHPNADQAHVQALDDLQGGAVGVHLVFANTAHSLGFGLSPAKADIAYVLEDVFLDQLPIMIDSGDDYAGVSDALMAQARQRHIDAQRLNIDFGIDPFTSALHHGQKCDEAQINGALTYGLGLMRQGITSPLFCADGRLAHNAGASEAQELAHAISAGIAYLRLMDAQGVAPAQGRDRISFRLCADAHEFLSLAKMRALRRLWARIEDAMGLTPKALHLHVDSSWRMMTQRDPWVNLLRTTVASFAAGLGGADSITVLPFTQAVGLPDAFARRLARNTQMILLMEAHLAHVDDPAAGAGGFEALTDELCQKAWQIFQQIEKVGGYVHAAAQGLLHEPIAQTRLARQRNIARRKDTLTGSSDFPLLNEAPIDVVLPLPKSAHAPSPRALVPQRLAQEFEDLRDRSDAFMHRHHRRPNVFLANFGAVAAFTARATFAKNFFEAAGIEAMGNDGFNDHAALCASATQANCDFICLCSSDALYSEHGPALIAALSQASKGLYLAGRMKEQDSAWRALGVRDFIYAGCDALAVLTSAHQLLQKI
jgi:methylmalonyl-CoA mutase